VRVKGEKKSSSGRSYRNGTGKAFGEWGPKLTGVKITKKEKGGCLSSESAKNHESVSPEEER